ncbi:GNAT family N-acetyltransferase [Burkholderia contaminans]|jgi:GNAT superfamily N-acetyltransferase|uniref:GNAT family N-acetyltransferase n=1 Tax=Burkholderia contaminans TaxID=488447 RepID=A0AAP4R202_9BURK|nr:MULTISPECIES: GNAT family N-acetyltransferase [Burkholderia]MBD1417217.1 GNAT family N-acetyltransferase [Burkholderia contaminans]MBH9666723.1 GNAT family N-acetyltransferase [Burkholderia contaminans]MBH9673729.1 GNAT family N-acetyltransferase [Burkholderia contaminans]MBH9703774.1 GNAT family N-acetyltransferase [Burkholderia contaminans]MBH9719768.1 GNAT family N-acetyltransferase [Burkholderia contaminans]
MNARIWGEFKTIRGALIAAAIAVGALPGYAMAEIECQRVTVKEGSALNSTWGKDLHHLQSTGDVDNTVNSLCSPDWVHADDYWLYGNYYPLHRGHSKQGDGARLFVQSRPKQPELARYLCKDTGVNGAIPYEKATPIGVFAYETFVPKTSKATDIAKQVELHVLCVDRNARGQGLGIQILNEAVQRVTEGVSDDKRVRMQLTSHVKAHDFYDRLDMTCRDEGEGGAIARVYERTLTHGERIERRRPIYYMDLHDNGQCKRVTFGCGHRDNYDKLRKLAFDSEASYEHGHDNEVFFIGDWAGDYGCDADAAPISYDDVIRKLDGHTQ